jgi:hypothetical protein
MDSQVFRRVLTSGQTAEGEGEDVAALIVLGQQWQGAEGIR